MKCHYLALLLVSTFLVSCQDDPVDQSPNCIQLRIDEFRADPTVCSTTGASIGGNVVTFDFRSETVYCFNWGSCNPNQPIEIYSENCDLICQMSIQDANSVCDGVPWRGNARELDNLYQN